MTARALIPVDVLEAKVNEHRVDAAKMKMQLVLYRQALEEAGIEPPDKDGEELLALYRDCQAVISTASELSARLGSARELLR